MLPNVAAFKATVGSFIVALLLFMTALWLLFVIVVPVRHQLSRLVIARWICGVDAADALAIGESPGQLTIRRKRLQGEQV
jgi:hypothetical protein